MKKIIVFILVITAAFSLSAQNFVSNVNWEIDDSEEKIIITYDLEKDGSYRYLNVSLKVYIDNNEFSPKALSGDVGDYIRSGMGKKIIWDVFADVTELSGDLTIEIIAISPKVNTSTADPEPVNPQAIEIKRKTVPVYAGLGGVVALGGGLVVAGIGLESDSKEIYDVYKQFTDPNDSSFDELTRQEHYDEANSKHKNAQWMTYGGIAVIVTGGVILIKRIIDVNKLRNRNLSITPQIEFNSFPNRLPNPGLTNTELGIKLSYRF
jgi:hypothetical protein